MGKIPGSIDPQMFPIAGIFPIKPKSSHWRAYHLCR
jgi:hypothetical protein